MALHSHFHYATLRRSILLFNHFLVFYEVNRMIVQNIDEI